MREIAGLPFWELHFDASGHLVKHVGAIPSTVTDLFIAAHAWQNQYNDASDLYGRFFGHLAALLVELEPHPAAAEVGLIGVYWPSSLLPEDEPQRDSASTANFGTGSSRRATPEARQAHYRSIASTADTVGARGLRPFLTKQTQSARVHLLGHSFGGKLIASALAAPNIPASSACFIQGTLPGEEVAEQAATAVKPRAEASSSPVLDDPAIAQLFLKASEFSGS